jgi:hypothetical protein
MVALIIRRALFLGLPRIRGIRNVIALSPDIRWFARYTECAADRPANELRLADDWIHTFECGA